jgi:hypothetical protein
MYKNGDIMRIMTQTLVCVLKITTFWAGGVAQVVERPPSMLEVLDSIPSTTNKRKIKITAF